MYKVKTQTAKFDTNSVEDLKEYDAILNNPLCTIIREIKEKLSTKHFDDEGKPTYQDDKLVLVVTWQEKALM